MSDDRKIARLLNCADHGARVWQGHVMCDACGRVFQTKSDKQPRFAPPKCPCGSALIPPPSAKIGDDLFGLSVAGTGAILDEDGNVVDAFKTHESQDWSARPICYLCFRQIDKRCGGRIPNYAEQRAKRDGN
jgi:hypothetical protein